MSHGVSAAILETDEHIFVGCSAAIGTWGRLHITILGDTFRRPWELDLAVALPKAVKVDMLLLIHWHIWKTRNGRVFFLESHSTTKTPTTRTHTHTL